MSNNSARVLRWGVRRSLRKLAPSYVFLASEESRFITGAVLDLTGGEMLP